MGGGDRAKNTVKLAPHAVSSCIPRTEATDEASQFSTGRLTHKAAWLCLVPRGSCDNYNLK